MCAPNVESISNTGKVTIVFSKPVVPVESSLYEEIAASGVIQANLLLGTEMSDANLKVAQEAYNFTFTIQEITTTNMYL